MAKSIQSEMILTDLNIDCLEGILEHLELAELCNVADSHKRLRVASKNVFKNKYNGHRFNLTWGRHDLSAFDDRMWKLYLGDSYTSTNSPSLVEFKHNSSHNIKPILQTLRIFGSLISRIEYNLNSHITDYLHEYCNENLTDIEFWQTIHYEHHKLGDIRKPFTGVKTVSISANSRSYFGPKNNLLRLFPNMQILNLWLEVYTLVNDGCIANHFPFLEKFYIRPTNISIYKKNMDYVNVFKSFLQLNPQLKSLSMNCEDNLDFEILQVLDNRDQHLEHLDLLDEGRFFSASFGRKIHLKTVKHLSIKVRGKSAEFIQIESIPFSFEQLKSFECNILCRENTNAYIYEFLGNNPSITKLSITGGPVDFFRLAQSLPFLEEFSIGSGSLSFDDVHNALDLLRNLKEFVLICEEHVYTQLLQSQLNNEWSIVLSEILETIPYFDNPTRYRITLKCRI